MGTPIAHVAIPLVNSAFKKLEQAEAVLAEYLNRTGEFDQACAKVYRAALPSGKSKMPHKDAISQLNYWFEAMKPLLSSKGLLARLPEIQEARMCITKEKWKRDGMSEDDFTTFYYTVLKSVANYGDGSHVPTVSWDTEPGDIGLLNSEGNPVRDSPLYQRTKPKVVPAKWDGDASVARSLAATLKKGVAEEEEEDDEDDDFDDFDFPEEDEMEDFAAAQAVFNYMSLPSFDKRRESDGESDDDGGKSARKKAPVAAVESEDEDEDAELRRLAKAGVRVADDKEEDKDDDGPITYDADGASRGLQDKEVF